MKVNSRKSIKERDREIFFFNFITFISFRKDLAPILSLIFLLYFIVLLPEVAVNRKISTPKSFKNAITCGFR